MRRTGDATRVVGPQTVRKTSVNGSQLPTTVNPYVLVSPDMAWVPSGDRSSVDSSGSSTPLRCLSPLADVLNLELSSAPQSVTGAIVFEIVGAILFTRRIER